MTRKTKHSILCVLKKSLSWRCTMANEQKYNTLNKKQSNFLKTALEKLLKNPDANYDHLVRWLMFGEMPKEVVEEYIAANSAVSTSKIKALGIKSLITNLKNKGLGTDFTVFKNLSFKAGDEVSLNNVIINPNLILPVHAEKLQNAGVRVEDLVKIMADEKVPFISRAKKNYVERLVLEYNKTVKPEEKIDLGVVSPILKTIVVNQLSDFRNELTETETVRIGYSQNYDCNIVIERLNLSFTTAPSSSSTLNNKDIVIAGKAPKGNFTIAKKIDDISEKYLGDKAEKLLSFDSKKYSYNSKYFVDNNNGTLYVNNNYDTLRKIIAINGLIANQETLINKFVDDMENNKLLISGWIEANKSKYTSEEALKKDAIAYAKSFVPGKLFESVEDVNGVRYKVPVCKILKDEILTHTQIKVPTPKATSLWTLETAMGKYLNGINSKRYESYQELLSFTNEKVVESYNKNEPVEAPKEEPKVEPKPVEKPVDTDKGGSEEVKTKVAFVLVDKDNNIIKPGEDLDAYLASLSETKRQEVIDKTVSYVILGVTDEAGNPVPVTREIVDKVPAPHVQLSNNITKIAAGAFVGNPVEQVSFHEAYNPFNTQIEEGAFDPNIRIFACGKQENKIKDGEVIKVSPQYKYYEFTPESFASSVNNNSLHKRINRVVYTPHATAKPVPYVETGSTIAPTTTHARVKAEPKSSPVIVPYAVDHDRSLNSGFGRFVKWTIKRPVWSTLALAGGTSLVLLLVSSFIPGVRELLLSLELISTSIVVMTAIVAGVIQIGKQLLKIFSKRYRSMFLKDKAQKINKKITKKLIKIHENLHKAEEIVKNEVGLLHGNASKETGKKQLSLANKIQIKAWHKEYNKLLEESKKLKEEAKHEKAKLDEKVEKIDKLEEEIGGENEKKKARRKAASKNLDEAFKVYEKAIKDYGRLYEHDEEHEEGDSTEEDIYEYYASKQKAKKADSKPEEEDLDQETTGDIKESVENRLESISERYHSILFQDKAGYNKETVEENKPKEEPVVVSEDPSLGK